MPGRAFLDQGDGGIEGSAEIEVSQLELHPARLDLRQVQDVVDKREQMMTRGVNILHVLRLLVVELSEHALAEHLGKADDCVQRGAQLMAHVGQKV